MWWWDPQQLKLGLQLLAGLGVALGSVLKLEKKRVQVPDGERDLAKSRKPPWNKERWACWVMGLWNANMAAVLAPQKLDMQGGHATLSSKISEVSGEGLSKDMDEMVSQWWEWGQLHRNAVSRKLVSEAKRKEQRPMQLSTLSKTLSWFMKVEWPPDQSYTQTTETLIKRP